MHTKARETPTAERKRSKAQQRGGPKARPTPEAGRRAVGALGKLDSYLRSPDATLTGVQLMVDEGLGKGR